MPEVKLGTWSTVLLLGSLHGLVMAALLLSARRNRRANRCLAALLFAVVLLITPFTLGYAGAYDAWPWLSFAPFFWQLGFGPLIWLYVRQLGEPALPRRWGWHFLPAALQGGYFIGVFAQPVAAKWAWDEHVHLPLVAPWLDTLIYVSLATYWTLAYRAYRRYQQWLEASSGAREEFRLHWLRGFLWAMALAIAIDLGFTLIDRWLADLDYFDMFPLYLALVALVYYLGVEGWRHADARYPQPSATVPEPALDPPERPAGERDWAALGRRYAQQVAERGWWREPDLDLADLARRLGTNTLYLSRALNDGLGQSFSEFLNRQRIQAAQARLAGEDSILAIAEEVGFGSKASFNRAFRAYAGCTPSEYRRGLDSARRIS